MTTLYGINKEQATILVEHFDYHVDTIALVLWNNGKASSIERGIYKAQKLIKLARS